MEHPDSEDTADKNGAGASAENSEAPTTRPSAIERQIAAASRIGYGHQTHQEAADSEIGRGYYYAKRRRHRRFGLVGFLVLFLFVATGAAVVFTEFGRPLQNIVSAALQSGGQEKSMPHTPPARAVAPQQAPYVATPNVISVPVAEVSLRDRPELLAQLVQVYRSQLAANPTDSAALAALNRLREQSLSQLEAIMAVENDPASAKSREIVSRVFPELTDNPRYESLIVRSGQIQRGEQAEPPAEPPHSTPLTTAISSPPVSPVKKVSPPSDPSIEIAKKPDANVSPAKPQIRVLSVTPGTMIEQRFVPSEEGTAFMVEISYRNFKNSDDQSEVTLVALLGTPGDPTVLAEVPVEISGDRGTKSFLMETLIPGNAGEKYRLNFTLSGEFLASSTVRLSVPPRRE